MEMKWKTFKQLFKKNIPGCHAILVPYRYLMFTSQQRCNADIWEQLWVQGGILLSFPRENSLNSFILKQDIWGNRRALHSRGSRWSSLGLQGTFSWLAFVFVWFWLWVIPVMFFVLQSHKNDIFILEGAINREAGMELHNAPDEFILCSSAGIESPKVFRGQSSAGSPSIKDRLQLPSPF